MLPRRGGFGARQAVKLTRLIAFHTAKSPMEAGRLPAFQRQRIETDTATFIPPGSIPCAWPGGPRHSAAGARAPRSSAPGPSERTSLRHSTPGRSGSPKEIRRPSLRRGSCTASTPGGTRTGSMPSGRTDRGRRSGHDVGLRGTAYSRRWKRGGCQALRCRHMPR